GGPAGPAPSSLAIGHFLRSDTVRRAHRTPGGPREPAPRGRRTSPARRSAPWRLAVPARPARSPAGERAGRRLEPALGLAEALGRPLRPPARPAQPTEEVGDAQLLRLTAEAM